MEANQLHLIRARVPSPFGWTFVPGGQRVLCGGTVLVQLVSPLRRSGCRCPFETTLSWTWLTVLSPLGRRPTALSKKYHDSELEEEEEEEGGSRQRHGGALYFSLPLSVRERRRNWSLHLNALCMSADISLMAALCRRVSFWMKWEVKQSEMGTDVRRASAELKCQATG
ncbi:hypothetical protein EYF80_002899 [Liparis tanakae]|uniref:Uncharacterized protein n=1 Tax=Liparis tanakae TaxID=230148 RepID=A0A4Z2J920_9TELE|nr:hypothetical protein EYF80_002899 [Liparis tanakae]